MRVIYNTCYADPWVKVAQNLKNKYGWEPVYWNGYDDDDSKKIIPKEFPNCIYQSYYNAWNGIFAPQITNKYADSYINIDFLKEYASYELQAIKMMDRMDPDRYSFNFMERQRHFRKLVKYWTACIDLLKPDLVVSAIVPHRVYDYVLYLLCKYHKIKYITFRNSAFQGIIIPLTDVFSINNILDDDYQLYLNPDFKNLTLSEKIDKEIHNEYQKVQKDYAEAEPDYMKQHEIQHKQSSGLFSLANKFLKDRKQSSYDFFGKEGILLTGFPTYHKQRKKSVEKSRLSLLKYSLLKMQTNKYKSRLKSYYNNLVEKPDLSKKYVILPLHYQPEMTSNPSGDIFADQLLCVETLAKHLPDDYLIYVKEHRSQFYAHTEGYTGRIYEFYDDLKQYKQVRLIPLDFDIFHLIKNSKAIATVTGTSGWEGMVLGKPVIIFGLSWYEKYAGVLKVTDEVSACRIISFIDNFRFDEHNLLAYLAAFSKKAVKAYYYRGLKEKMNQPEEECVNNLVNAVLSTAKHPKV
jgi:hypothetical protein